MKTSFLAFLAESKSSKKVALVNFNVKEVRDAFRKHFRDLDVISFDQPYDYSSADFVVFGTTGKHPKQFEKAEKELKAKHIPYFVYGAKHPLEHKDDQFRKMEKAGISQIPTKFLDPKKGNVQSLVKEFGLPLVVKPINGSQGKGVKLIKSENDLKKYLEKSTDKIVTVQKFVKNDGDWRLFFLGNELIYAIVRKSSDSKEFRNNTSLGGSAQNKVPPKEIETLAKKAHDVSGLDISGVDVIVDKETGKAYIMEVNAAPQFYSDEKRFKKVINKIFGLIDSSK
jgi:D-alanine-D-alanine ligase-like ATP-grasp enzyme